MTGGDGRFPERASVHPRTANGSAIDVTVSVGAAAGSDDPDALLRAADASLYEAKRTGRNRVVTTDLSRPD